MCGFSTSISLYVIVTYEVGRLYARYDFKLFIFLVYYVQCMIDIAIDVLLVIHFIENWNLLINI